MKIPQINLSNLQHVKRLVLFSGIFLLVLSELIYFFVFHFNLGHLIIQLLFGLSLMYGLVTMAFHYGERLQDQLLQEIAHREEIARELHVRSSALEAAVNAVVITNRQGQIIWVNPAFTTLTGYVHDEVVGRRPSFLRSGAHDEAFYRQMWQTILSGQAWQGELVNVRKDGRFYTEEQSITPVRDQTGEISHFIAIKQDISKRQQAQAALKQFAERLEAIHAIDQAILARRSTAEIIYEALERLRSFVSWTRASVMLVKPDTNQTTTYVLMREAGRTLQQSIPYRLEDERALQFAQRNEIRYEPDLRQNNGSELYEWLGFTGVRAYASVPILAQADELIGLLNLASETPHAFTPEQLAIAREITNSLAIGIQHSRLYIAERAQRERAEALQRTGAAINSTLEFQQVMDLIMDQVARVVPFDMGNMILIQERTAHISHTRGYEKFDPTLPKQIAQLSFDLEQTPNLRHILQTRQPLIIDDVWEYPGWLRNKGAYQTRAWVGVPILINGHIAVIFALSKCEPYYYGHEHVELLQAFATQAGLALENAQLYEQLRAHAAMLEERVVERTRALAQANEQLTELDRLKTKFIADISHELRTPITNVNIYLDLLEHGKPERQLHYRQVLKQETQRLTHLIENIFDESRQTSHLRQSEYHLVNLNQIVHDVLTAHEEQIKARNLSLSSTLDPELPFIWGEQSHLARALANLLANAINYTPQGTVSVTTSHNEQNIYLRVADTGIGIAPEDVPHLFGRFYRGRNVSQSTIPGVGLGLGVVKEIVSLHHGEIRVQPREGGGTVFEVQLPIPEQ
jgi:PAS domain S-box-containing protein